MHYLFEQSKSDPWLKQAVAVVQPLRAWLTEQGSLTRRLKAHYPDVLVEVLENKWAKTNIDEAMLLGIKSTSHAYNRAVLLMGDNSPLVYAHTVIPAACIKRGWSCFVKQGNKPLGETLFADHTIKRSNIAYQKLNKAHPIVANAHKYLTLQGYPLPQKEIWARRSLFCTKRVVTGEHSFSMQMIVTEVFLTDFK